METRPFVSIVIPTWRTNDVLKDCLESLSKQDYPQDRFEIILVSKESLEVEGQNIRTIPIGQDVNHAQARNIGVKQAKGELLGFVDDDCTMPPGWLSNAVRYFREENIAVVGGPALAPPRQPFRWRSGSYIAAAPFATGFASIRYRCGPRKHDANEFDLILTNNVVRKQVFDEVGGFDSDQVPCEENDFYLKIQKHGGKLLYAPDVVVWHRSKPIFLPLAGKIFFYAIGRGVFMARVPDSLRLVYLVPTLFGLSLVALPLLSIFSRLFFYMLLAEAILYLGGQVFNVIYVAVKFDRNPVLWGVIPIGTFITHLAYGLGVLVGLCKYAFNRWRGGTKMVSKY